MLQKSEKLKSLPQRGVFEYSLGRCHWNTSFRGVLKFVWQAVLARMFWWLKKSYSPGTFLSILFSWNCWNWNSKFCLVWKSITLLAGIAIYEQRSDCGYWCSQYSLCFRICILDSGFWFQGFESKILAYYSMDIEALRGSRACSMPICV